MFGSQSLILSFILRSIEAFLVVDRTDIEGKLLSSKGNIELTNVKLKSIKVPLEKTINKSNNNNTNHRQQHKHHEQHRRFVVVTGSISKIGLQWNFLSKTEQNSTTLVLEGLRLRISNCCDPAEEEEEEIANNKNNTPSPKQTRQFSFGDQILNEFRDLKESITTYMTESITKSEYVKKPIQAILDSISFLIFDLIIEVEVPSYPSLPLPSPKEEDTKQEHQRLQNPSYQIFVTLAADSIQWITDEAIFEFVAIKDAMRKHPLKMRCDFNSVSIDLMFQYDEKEEEKEKNGGGGNESTKPSPSKYPIVEKFSYSMEFRRHTGTRFFDMTKGYQAIGRRLSSARMCKENGDNNGFVIHLEHPEQIQSLYALAKFYVLDNVQNDDQDNVDNDDTENDDGNFLQNRHHRNIASSNYLSSATPFIIVFLFSGLVWKIVNTSVTTINSISELFQSQDNILPGAVIIAIIAGLISEVSTRLHMMENFGSLSKLDTLYQQAASGATQQNQQQHQSAAYRLPIEYITLIGPDGLKITLSQTSLVGKLDASVLNFSADRFEFSSFDQHNFTGPRISAIGIRAAVNFSDIILNIDETYEFYIPGQIQITEPIYYTVLSFQHGQLKVKISEVEAQILRGMREEFPAAAAANSTMNVANSFDSFQKGLRKGANIAANTTGNVKDKIEKGISKTSAGFKGTLAKTTRGVKGTLLGRNVKKEDKVPREIETTTTTQSGGELKHTIEMNTMLVGDISKAGKVIQIRNAIKKQNQESLQKLRLVAMEFESISLQKNRYNLRLYPNTFRGNHAVDFLLATKLAKSRSEAVRIGRSLQDDFDLFEHITREVKFRDDHNCLYHFVEMKKRRNWEDDSSTTEDVDVVTKSLMYEFDETPDIPFPVAISCKRFVLKFWQDQEVALDTKDALIFARPGSPTSRVVNVKSYFGQIQNHLVNVVNARIRAKVHPDLLPNEVHCLQFSVDNLSAAPGLSVQEWYNKFGFSSEEEIISKPSSNVVSLPNAHISPFCFRLRWQGTFVHSSKETNITNYGFDGDEKTTSRDLIMFFVKKVLGRAPGLLGNIRVMGVNVSDSAALTATATTAANFIPFGQYLGLATLAVIDSVTGAIDAGKASRDDPYGDYRVGDGIRGIGYAAKAAARKGATRRGKTKGFYVDDDEVPSIDGIDFAVGAAEGIGNYAKNNKAKFAGGTVGAATMIACAVPLGPLACIIIGIGAATTTEWMVNKAEERFEKKHSEKSGFGSEDNDADYVSAHSTAFMY